ncbi:MAG: hydroxylase, partial [Acidobacteriota bacterium]
MKIFYLEIVTAAADETVNALEKTHGVTFGDAVPELGNARTADLKDGGKISVRAPLRDDEGPVVRPYILVEDIQGAIKAAEEAGATVALPPMEIPGQGLFAIYILGG